VNKPLFSILHTTARPDKWRAVYDDWISKAAHPEQVEYVLCVDERWGFGPRVPAGSPASNAWPFDRTARPQDRSVWNEGRKCYVDGVNTAARASTGQILIVNADDQFACEKWDTALLDAISSAYSHDGEPMDQDLDGSWVIEVSTGTPQEHDRGIMVMPILSRARYEQQGSEVFYPAYESLCADNDFCEWARQDAVVIDARHLIFPHRHPLFDSEGKWKQATPEDWDQAYQVQNRKEAYDLGKRILARRRVAHFQSLKKADTERRIALCFAGEHFEGPWVDGLLALYGHVLGLEFLETRLIRGYTTNVYKTRAEIHKAVMGADPRPDLVLWLDDDNILTSDQFDQLLEDLDSRLDVDGVMAWCWVHDPEKRSFRPSCGLWSPDHIVWLPFDSSFANLTGLRHVETGGFPCFLMRLSALEKAGENPFIPILDSRLPDGFTGEDISFFLNAEKGGAKFLVDPQVRVKHVKYVEVEPVFPEEGKPDAVKVACMIRAKNEARWIARAIESVKPLCGEKVFVMEDGSQDDTFDLAVRAGAQAFHSPFADQGFDECRDKNWLMEQVIAACSPDWILGLDGDEELEPEGAEKIKRILSRNPPVDCFGLRFLYLWDGLDQIRVDGRYSSMTRQSLFRALPGYKFEDYYPDRPGTHAGLHCSNAPFQMRTASMNVFLLHYGYVFKMDRIRKYRWIRGIDPVNEVEDNYRHMVQGDLPDFPADAKFKHGGPLELRKLPARLVPRFDVMPGPAVSGSAVPAAEQQEDIGLANAGLESYVEMLRQDESPEPSNGAVRLNLGCCDHRAPGFLGVDLSPGPAVDVVTDLNGVWPWSDSSVSEILARDIVEHLSDAIHTMNEMHRVLKPGGKVTISVPTTNGTGAFQDPTHRSFWNRRSFLYYEKGNPYRERFAERSKITAAFRVLGERTEQTQDGERLTIQLGTVA